MSTIIKTKPLCEMSWSELFESQEDCIVWLMENTLPDKKRREMQRLKSAIKSEVYSRESKQRHGAMFAPKPVNREEDGEILYA